MINCINNLIGLTDKDCSCFDSQKPEDFEEVNASESGLYITNDEFGIPMQETIYESIGCGDQDSEGNDNLYTVLQKIRSDAITKLGVDLPAALLHTRSEAIFPFSGMIGQRKFNASNTINSAKAGIQLRPQSIRDAQLTITKIHVGFLANSSFDLTIESDNPDFDTVTETLTGTGGQFTPNTLETPLVIPFQADGMERLKYFFSYDVDGKKPLNNAFYCCSTRHPWMKHIQAGGFHAATIDYDYTYSGTQANGLVLEGYVSCDNLAWICTLDELGGQDFKNVLASALVHKCTAILAQYILDQRNINVYTLLNREGLYGKRNAARKNYMDTINWIASNLPAGITDCYTCKPSLMRRTSL